MPGGAGRPLFAHFSDPVPKGVFWEVPWLILAPLWLNFGRFLVAFGSFFINFSTRFRKKTTD